MPTSVILPSFAAGELSPALHGRVDLAKYQVGLATCLNWFIHPFGGASTRAGTAFVGEAVDHGVRSRLIPFQFNTQQTYVLEFADAKMRVIKDGGYVLETPVTVSGISRANPAVVTATAHGYLNGDHVWIEGVTGMTQANRRRYTVAGVTANTFQLVGPGGAAIDSSTWSSYVSGGTVARFYTLSTLYAAQDLALLKFVQSADTMTLTHPGHPPRQLTRTGHAAWTLQPITFAPAVTAPAGVTATPSSSGSTSYSYVVTAIDNTTGEESLASSAATCSNGALSSSVTNAVAWTAVANCDQYNIYKLRNGLYGWIGNASAAGFTDDNIKADTSDTPPQQRNPFNPTAGYPGCSTYHDGRQWYGRTDKGPQTLWASQSANFNNMSVSQPTKDSDAIVRTIASREVNEIRHLVSLNALLVFTSGAEWKCWAGSQSDVITPANTNLKPQGYTGAAHVPPIVSGSSVLFVTPSGRKVRDIAYDYSSDAWGGRDLSILAGHLFEGRQIEEWAYARDPDSLVWCQRSDGVLLGFTYLKEHDVYAWSRHVTDGAVESLCVVQEGNESALYLLARRTIGGQTRRYVERLASRLFASVEKCWCVDSGYRYDGWNSDPAIAMTLTGAAFAAGNTVTLAATGGVPFTAASVGNKYILRSGGDQVTVTVSAYTSGSIVSAHLDYAAAASLQAAATADWALASVTLEGLWHLEGRSVAILADGSVQPAATVSNGRVTLPRASGSILAGLPFICDLETLDIELGPPTLQGRRKRVPEIVLRVKDTRGLAVGPDFDRLVEIKERSVENFGEATTLATGDERVLVDPLWDSDGRIAVRQRFPLPATIVAIMPSLEAGE